MGSSEGHYCFAVGIRRPQTTSMLLSPYLFYLFIGTIPSVANGSVSDTRPWWCLKHQNIEALLVISLSQVPLCLANMYGAAWLTKACRSLEGWIAKEGPWYVFRLTWGFFKWSYASSGLWFDLVFRGICDCTTKSLVVFAAAAFLCWLLAAHGRCHWRSSSDFPTMDFVTSVFWLNRRVNSQRHF